MIKQGNIRYLVMIFHIGKKRTIRDGKPLPTVFISDDNNRGCHFVAAFVNFQKKVIYYGDSLGWSSPENLVSLAQEYTKYIRNKECTNDFQIIHYHEPTEENIYHSCSDSCTGIYPLQSDSHICGIVAIVMSALFAWTEHFTHMAQFSYLASPSIYNKFLRFIVIFWFVKGKIDCGLLQIENISGCDILTNNDDEEVTFVDFPLTDNKETTKCNKNVKENMRKCNHCSFETKKTSNLKRHAQRFHGADLVKDIQLKRGFCLCFECGQKFHKIRDLQSHLTSSHNHKLHFETKTFNSFQGK